MEKALTIADRSVTSLAFSPDGSIITGTCRLLGPQGGGVMLWDARSGLRMVDRLQEVAEGSEGELAFSADGETLAVGILGIDQGGFWCRALRRHPTLANSANEARGSGGGRRHWSLALSPDGKTLAVGFRNINAREAGQDLTGRRGPLRHRPESWKERGR